MNRIECLQFLARRQRARSYLEIGVKNGDAFFAVPIRRKIGVDSVRLRFRERLRAARTYPLNSFSRIFVETSDEFFERRGERVLGRRGVDLGFVDGKHTYPQALRDITNALRYLSPRGLIVVHDTNPGTAAEAWPGDSPTEVSRANPSGWNGIWCGDVWKAIIDLRSTTDVGIRTLPDEFGVTVVNPRIKGEKLGDDLADLDVVRFEDLDRNRERWLLLCTPNELEGWLELDPALTSRP